MFIKKRVRVRKSDGKKIARYAVIWTDQDGQHEKAAGTTKEAAYQLMRNLEKQRANGTLGKPKVEDPTFKDFCETFLEDKEHELKPSTLKDYESVIDNHLVPFFGKERLSTIGPARVAAFMRHLKKKTPGKKEVTPAMQGKILRYLRSILRRAVALEYVQHDPCRAIRAPKVEKKTIHPLTPEEVVKLLDAADGFMRPLLAVACYAGLRQGEILALRWQDIDFDNNLIHVTRSYSPAQGFTTPKTEASIRMVPMIATLKAMLEDYRPRKAAPGALVFHNRDGGPLDKSNLLHRKLAVVEEGENKYNPKRSKEDKEDRFEIILSRAGLRRIRFHDLRHTYASLSILAGVDLKTLQMCMGHSSIAVTANIYSHLYTDSYDRAGITLENLVAGGLKVVPLEAKK